jgi:hypothetical protein
MSCVRTGSTCEPSDMAPRPMLLFCYTKLLTIDRREALPSRFQCRLSQCLWSSSVSLPRLWYLNISVISPYPRRWQRLSRPLYQGICPNQPLCRAPEKLFGYWPSKQGSLYHPAVCWFPQETLSCSVGYQPFARPQAHIGPPDRSIPSRIIALLRWKFAVSLPDCSFFGAAGVGTSAVSSQR